MNVNKQNKRNGIIIGGAVAIAVSLMIMCAFNLNTKSKWCPIFLVIFSHFLLGIGIFIISYHFSFRWLPNLAIAGAWTIIIIILVTDIRNYCLSEEIARLNELIKNAQEKLKTLLQQSDTAGLTGEKSLLVSVLESRITSLQAQASEKALVEVPSFVTLLKEAYNSSKIGSSYIKTFLEIYGIGVFGTVFISMATEATKSLWSDEIRSAENKTLLAKFKRARRQRLLARKFFFSTILVSVVYIHIFYYLIAFLVTVVATIVLSSHDVTIIRINILLLLMSVSMEAIGAATHFIVTDQTLAASEIKYLNQKKTYINELCKKANPDKGAITCNGVRYSREVSNYLQVLVHSYCNHSGGDSISKQTLYPDASNCCRLQIAKNLISRFYRTKEIFISPNKEAYYASASIHFEPDFALDIIKYLFHESDQKARTGNGNTYDKEAKLDTEPKEEHKTNELLTSALSLLDIARKSMFSDQHDEWKDWLYPSNINYEQMMSLIMLDCIRIRFADPNNIDSPCFDDFCTGDHKIVSGAFLLEFPFIVKQALLSRISDGSFSISNRAKNLDEHFRERTEQYYYNLFCAGVNSFDSSACNLIAQYFTQTLQARYDNSAFDLQRILPIRANDCIPSNNKPVFSLRLSWIDWCNLSLCDATLSKKTDIPGWHNLFEQYINKCSIITEKRAQSTYLLHLKNGSSDNWMSIPVDIADDIRRIVAFDCRKGQAQIDYPHYGFCEDLLEQCQILSSILFEKVK